MAWQPTSGVKPCLRVPGKPGNGLMRVQWLKESKVVTATGVWECADALWFLCMQKSADFQHPHPLMLDRRHPVWSRQVPRFGKPPQGRTSVPLLEACVGWQPRNHEGDFAFDRHSPGRCTRSPCRWMRHIGWSRWSHSGQSSWRVRHPWHSTTWGRRERLHSTSARLPANAAPQDWRMRFSVARSRPRTFPPLSKPCLANTVGNGWNKNAKRKVPTAFFFAHSMEQSKTSIAFRMTRASFAKVMV